MLETIFTCFSSNLYLENINTLDKRGDQIKDKSDELEETDIRRSSTLFNGKVQERIWARKECIHFKQEKNNFMQGIYYRTVPYSIVLFVL